VPKIPLVNQTIWQNDPATKNQKLVPITTNTLQPEPILPYQPSAVTQSAENRNHSITNVKLKRKRLELLSGNMCALRSLYMWEV
jgi:hypothetical protein